MIPDAFDGLCPARATELVTCWAKEWKSKLASRGTQMQKLDAGCRLGSKYGDNIWSGCELHDECGCRVKSLCRARFVVGDDVCAPMCRLFHNLSKPGWTCWRTVTFAHLRERKTSDKGSNWATIVKDSVSLLKLHALIAASDTLKVSDSVFGVCCTPSDIHEMTEGLD